MQALQSSPEDILSTLERAGERGRGGAGFPTGKKWRSCAQAKGEPRYVIANGDEGDPGSFIDRVLMENDPHGVVEGILLCGYAVGANQGIVFIRSEYPKAIARMREAIAQARAYNGLVPLPTIQERLRYALIALWEVKDNWWRLTTYPVLNMGSKDIRSF